MFITVFLPIIIETVSIGLTGLITFLVMRSQIKKEISKNQKAAIYEIKKDAILQALFVANEYISWLTLDRQPKRAKTTPTELTIKTRETFEKLCVTVDNKELIDAFLDIFFDQDTYLDGLKVFRNICRKELGLSEIDFSEDRIFISAISTDDLEMNN